MKKQIFKNFPTTDKRGHYFYYDDEAPASVMDSDSLPPKLDKFNNSALYTSVQDSLINRQILKYGLGYTTNSQIKINILDVVNNGVSRPIASPQLDVWMFDGVVWGDAGLGDVNSNQGPEVKSYDKLYEALYKNTSGCDGQLGKHMTDKMRGFTDDEGATFPNTSASPISARFFRYRPGDISENKGMGKVIKDDIIIDDLDQIGDLKLTTNGSRDNYSSEYAFNPILGPILDTTDQFIYIVTRTSGNGRIKNGKDKKRNQRYTIYKIPSKELYDGDSGKSDVYDLKPIKQVDGGGSGNTTQSAFKIGTLELYIDTEASLNQNYPPHTAAGFNLMWGDNTINDYNSEEVINLLADVKEPLSLNLTNLFQEFKNQSPDKEIIGHKYLNTDNSSFSRDIQKDFEPITRVNILGNDEYDLSAYQKTKEARQICSAPNQIQLKFYISDYRSSGNLGQTDGTGSCLEFDECEQYKFYVVDWNDVDNKFYSSEDYLADIPQNDSDMLKKQNQNLYKFTDLSEKLVHSYSTSGMKIIKAVLFSHLPTYENSQVVRWKFIETRIYLDIPITNFPDFGELGGRDFTTIPWPHTTPIIGGTGKNSKYKISLQNTLSGGKLAENEIIDIRFLTEADENDELGQSIQKLDLEQVRFIIGPPEGEGTYDMHTLLGINNSIVYDNTYLNELVINNNFESNANIGTYWGLVRYPRLDLGADGIAPGEAADSGDADGETYHPTDDYAIWDETNKWVEVSHYQDENYPNGVYDNSQTWLQTPSSVQVVEGRNYTIKSRVLYVGGANRALIEFYNGVSPNGTWVKSHHSGGGEFEDLEINFTSQKTGPLGLRLAVYGETGIAYFDNVSVVETIITPDAEFYPYTNNNYWDCRDWNTTRNYCFSGESSVGQIFIDDNLDLNLKAKCSLELNLGNINGKTIYDTNGNTNNGYLIGDYKIKKRQKNVPMKRDSFIKLPKKGTSDGAL